MDGRACCVIAAGGGLGGVEIREPWRLEWAWAQARAILVVLAAFPRDSYVFGVG